ncbi:hypothetical protein D6779_07855 [Candidatus Parcubacteria bacterium]|nr:MAG: hypothetical protein D6779_07855 [Candidatus Parcubacteria bacterium]
MRKTKFLLIALTILLAGCVKGQDIHKSSTATMTDTVTVVVPGNTKTPRPPTPINTPTQPLATPTLTLTPTAGVRFPRTECLEVVPKFPQTASRTGSVVFVAPSWGDIPPIKILNLETLEPIFIDYDAAGPGISPDRHWFAFEAERKLMLMDASGGIYEIVDWDEEWYLVEGWLNKNQILISKYPDSPPPSVPPLGVIDIRTKEYREIERNYPGIDYPEGAEEYDTLLSTTNLITFYNPRYPIVAYPGMKTFVLFDLSKKEIVAEVKDENIRPIFPPMWTPNGEYLLLAKEIYPPPGQRGHQEFFLISRDGTVSQITHFNDFHENSEIGGFSLSPDGQKVAFWFRDRAISWDENLYILDLQTLDVVDPCITSVRWDDGSTTGFDPNSPPIWSPDSKALATEVRLPRVDEKGLRVGRPQVLYLDITNGFAVKIAGDVGLIGWLVNQPAK